MIITLVSCTVNILEVLTLKTATLVGLKIKQIRNAKQMSQEELALSANMHASHIGQIERAEKNATIDTLEKIASALGVGIIDLFDFENIHEKSPTPNINKIEAYLVNMTDEEQEDVLDIVKTLNKWKKNADK